jgi:DUF917 family protein
MGEVIRIDEAFSEAAVLGGAVLGGGGGGWVEDGRQLARTALAQGFSEIVPLENVPDDAVLLTVAAVGCPSAGRGSVKPEDYIRAVTLFIEKTGATIQGLISNEIGAVAVVNGWLQSAALNLPGGRHGIPVIDAPANGRAHPTTLMGSMGLHERPDYLSMQTAVSGVAAPQSGVEAFFTGSLEHTSRLVRESAVKAGGMVAVARNLVSASYVRQHGAPGAIARALEIGSIWTRREPADAEKILTEVCDTLGAKFLIKGTVEKVRIKAEGGFDCGIITLVGASPAPALYELTFLNEYMTLDAGGERLATFPDLIMTFDARTALPLISAEIKDTTDLVIIAAPARRLILGAGMRDRRLFEQIERRIGKEIVKYLTHLPAGAGK